MPAVSSPFATDEPEALLWFEQSIHASVHIGAMAYGVHMTIYAAAMYNILKQKAIPWRSGVFITALFILASINICCNIRFNELAWIDERNYPGGPLAFMLEQQSNVVDTIGNSASVIATFLADALLVYRVYVVWGNMWLIVVVPILLFLAATVMSVLTVIQAAQPSSSLWSQATVSFAVPYWSMSMALSILLTILLVVRLLYARRKIRSALGPTYGKMYTSVASMAVESALPYGLVSFVFIILYAKGNTAENLFIPLLTQVECIAPELIVLRVILGRAWTSNTLSVTPVSNIDFRVNPNLSSTQPHPSTTDISMVTFQGGSAKELSIQKQTEVQVA